MNKAQNIFEDKVIFTRFFNSGTITNVDFTPQPSIFQLIKERLTSKFKK